MRSQLQVVMLPEEGTVSYAICQVVYTTISGTTLTITQGVQLCIETRENLALFA